MTTKSHNNLPKHEEIVLSKFFIQITITFRRLLKHPSKLFVGCKIFAICLQVRCVHVHDTNILTYIFQLVCWKKNILSSRITINRTSKNTRLQTKLIQHWSLKPNLLSLGSPFSGWWPRSTWLWPVSWPWPMPRSWPPVSRTGSTASSWPWAWPVAPGSRSRTWSWSTPPKAWKRFCPKV